METISGERTRPRVLAIAPPRLRTSSQNFRRRRLGTVSQLHYGPIERARTLVFRFPYFFFFPREGITLATAPATDDAIFATTPFFDLRFVFEPPDRFAVTFDFAAVFDPDFVFGLDFVAVFFAIADSAMSRRISTRKLGERKESKKRLHPADESPL